MFLYDDLDVYKNINCRSSYYVLKLWEEYIEQEIIANLGMRESMMISIYLDYDALFFTLTSDYKAIFTKNLTVNIQHIISALEELSTTINITLNNKDEYDLEFHMCSYFFDGGTSRDEGSIEVDCYASCNIQTYEKFKTDFLMALSKEFQYAIQRNYLNRNINADPACHFDADFEFVNMYMILNKKDFEYSIHELLKQGKISKIDVEVLKKINNIVSQN